MNIALQILAKNVAHLTHIFGSVSFAYSSLCSHSFNSILANIRMSKPVSVEYRGKIAVITLDNDKKLNALNQSLYYELAQCMREIATHDEVYITVLTGRGRYFSA